MDNDDRPKDYLRRKFKKSYFEYVELCRINHLPINKNQFKNLNVPRKYLEQV